MTAAESKAFGARIRREAVRLNAELGDWDLFSASFGWFRWKLEAGVTPGQEKLIEAGFREAELTQPAQASQGNPPV